MARGPTEPQSGQNDSLSVLKILGTDETDPPTLCPSANPPQAFLEVRGCGQGGELKGECRHELEQLDFPSKGQSLVLGAIGTRSCQREGHK